MSESPHHTNPNFLFCALHNTLDHAKRSVETWLAGKQIVIHPNDRTMVELRDQFIADALLELKSDTHPEAEFNSTALEIYRLVFHTVYMDKQEVAKLRKE